MPLILSGTAGVSGVDGSAGTPSYQGTDTNTGIFYPAADTIAFAEGGVEVARFDSSGNLGIGTTSPSLGLTVVKDNGSGYVASFRANTGSPALTIQTTGGITQIQGINSAFTDVANIAFQPSGGNVGIGTSSPNTKLHIFGASISDLRIASNNVSYVNYVDTGFSVQGTSTNHPMVFNTNNTERMRITSGGEVCIGTTSPSSLFHVAGGNIRCDGASGSGFKTVVAVNSGADRDIFLAGISGISNGFTIQYVNSGNALSVKYANLTTTASAANAFLDSGDANRLYRSTSSLRYKKDIEDIEQSNSDAVLNLRPVWYRSKADSDKKEWSWYGLIAEEVAEVEPRLVHWTYLDSDYDSVVEENGNIKKTLKEGAKLVPDGVQYERVAVLLLNVVKRQEQAIQEQQAMIEELKAKVAALEK